MKVVAVSGMSGSGKTSLVKSLATSLSCPYLLFDDFVDKTSYPKNMAQWVANGAQTSEIKTPRMDIALRELLSKSATDYIFIEEPFGRNRSPISSLINKVVFLDIPMDICLARTISRNIALPHDDSIQQINQYLAKYNTFLRDAYIKTNSQTRQTSDLIIHRMGSVLALNKMVTQWLMISE